MNSFTEAKPLNENSPDVILKQQGRAALVRLNRPKALNAVTHGMVKDLEEFYLQMAKTPKVYGFVMEAEGKGFSAGGDIRAIYEKGRSHPEEIARYYADEYQHNWTLERLMKPHLALINGVVMGGGVGITLYGTHRIAGENFRFAMPETGIGFFPDVGGSWFLSRLPGQLGLYLGLTGTIIGQADAYHLGLATHCIPSDKFATIREGVIEGEPIDALLASLHHDPSEGDVVPSRVTIDRLFSAPTLDEIIKALTIERGTQQEFAQRTLETLNKKSPLSLKITFEQLKRGRMYRNLKEALEVEYRLAVRFIAYPDLYEGIRAVIIDKDQNPKWQHTSMTDVDDGFVQSFFAPLPNNAGLVLKDHWART